MSSETYYLLGSTSKNPCTMDRSRHQEAQRSWLCAECKRPLPSAKSVDLTIQECVPDGTPLNSVFGTGLGIARRDFLGMLGEKEFDKHFYIGRLLRSDGTAFEEWVTFHGKYPIVLRGSKNVRCEMCGICGRHVYFATGARYLFPSPRSEVLIFDAFRGRLVATGKIAEQVALKKWQKLKCTKLPVLVAPKDSLPELRV